MLLFLLLLSDTDGCNSCLCVSENKKSIIDKRNLDKMNGNNDIDISNDDSVNEC